MIKYENKIKQIIGLFEWNQMKGKKKNLTQLKSLQKNLT